VAIAEVYETDVRFVREGQKATVNSGALAAPVTGRVERVGRLINKSDVFGIDPTAEADARVIEVRVRLDANTVTAGYNRHQVSVTIDTTGSGTPPTPAPPPPGTSR
jgi:HlyD family secretion protein